MRKNYLVIIDESDELKNAIYFAAKRSVANNANLIMLYVVRPAVNAEWASVGNLIEQEETSEGKKLVDFGRLWLRKNLKLNLRLLLRWVIKLMK